MGGKKDKIAGCIRSYKERLDKEIPQETRYVMPLLRLSREYLTENWSAYNEEIKKVQDAHQRKYMNCAFARQTGDMKAAESFAPKDAENQSELCLLFYIGWMMEKNREKADHWIKLAQKACAAGDDEDKRISRLLEGVSENPLAEIDRLTMHPLRTRVIYAALGFLYPRQRKECAGRVVLLNSMPSIPYYFLKKAAQQLEAQ